MNYEGSVSYLYSLQQQGMKFGLENITRLLLTLNTPQNAFRAIHIAGTNGKGSTCAIVSSILQASGKTTGLFTSPHLLSFTERIRVNGRQISQREVISLIEGIREKIAELGDAGFAPTFFEVVTAMAMLHFKRKGVQAAVLETGMGGRLDATNVIHPDVCVITKIGLDHGDYLGDSLEEIAGEKAGIIKYGIPVVLSPQEPEAGAAVQRKAEEKKCPLSVLGNDFFFETRHADLKGSVFDYRDERCELHDLFLPLAGVHQTENAAVAIRSVSSFWLKETDAGVRARSFEATVREGLRRVRWKGRLEMVSEDPPVLIDGAHNPQAADVLAAALKEHFISRFSGFIFILGIMKDKDIEGILKSLLPLSSHTIVTSPSYHRSASPPVLLEAAKALGFENVRLSAGVRDALDQAAELVRAGGSTTPHRPKGNRSSHTCPQPLIVITGSFYLLGEALELMGRQAVLPGLRE
jgi:dihydrofolate synthase / folylpolyglutamate synthase